MDKDNLIELEEQLVRQARFNENRKQGKQNFTATICHDPKSGTYIFVDGSAHQLGECFKQLLHKRPELRAVMKDAMDSIFYQIPETRI